MAILKQEITEQGQVATYHKILNCEFDAKYRQLHVTIGSYAGQKYRDAEKIEEQEKEEQLCELNAFRGQLSEKIGQIEAELPGLKERYGKLVDIADDIGDEPNLLNDITIETEKQEHLATVFKEMDEINTKSNELYQELEDLHIQDEKAYESIQAWTARVPESKCLYVKNYTLTADQSEAVNKILELVYPEIMMLEPFDGGKKV